MPDRHPPARRRRAPSLSGHVLSGRVGRRGAFLLLFGALFLFVAVGLLMRPPTPDPALFHTGLPLVVRLAKWTVCGALAIAFAFRPGTGRDWPGFVALVAPLILDSSSYLWATVVYLLSGGAEGHSWGWLGAVQGLVYIGVIFVVAGWPDPPRLGPAAAGHVEGGSGAW